MTHDNNATLLAENADLLLTHADEIARQPEFFYSPFGMLSVAYLGHPECCLGALVGLWAKGELTVRCPQCGGAVLIFSIGGSPLSGSHDWSGACKDCKVPITRSDLPVEDQPEFRDLFMPLRTALQASPNTAIIEKGERPRFSWEKGLVGESTPDIVIRAAIVPIPFAQVVEVLRSGTVIE